MRDRFDRWSKSVRLFQALILLSYAASAVQTIALGSPPGAVTQTMGGHVSAMWIGLLIGCPIFTLVGLWYRRKPGGLWLLVAGDAAAACAAAAYVAAVMQTTWAERATFAGWMAAALTVCAVIVLARDLLELREFGRVVKEVTGE